MSAWHSLSFVTLYLTTLLDEKTLWTSGWFKHLEPEFRRFHAYAKL